MRVDLDLSLDAAELAADLTAQAARHPADSTARGVLDHLAACADRITTAAHGAREETKELA
ncbi:hypothetical protein [Nocardia nova]